MALNTFLQRSLQGEEDGKTLPAPNLFISLRYAAAVAKTATWDTSDDNKVEVTIKFPWRKKKDDVTVPFFAADTYDSFVRRIKDCASKEFPNDDLTGECRLVIAQRPRRFSNTLITIVDDDSINDLYLLLQGVRDDQCKDDIDPDKKYRILPTVVS